MSTISLDINLRHDNPATKTLNNITVNTVNTANSVSATAGSFKRDNHTVTRTAIDSAMHDGDDVAARDTTRNNSVRTSSDVINDVISMTDVFKLIGMMLKMLFNKAPPRSLLESSADLLKISKEQLMKNITPIMTAEGRFKRSDGLGDFQEELKRKDQ